MIRAWMHWLRIYLAEAWLGYHGRFALTSPFGYLAGKFGFPFFLMLFFIYLGKHVGYADPLYIVIGNMLLIPATNALGGVTLGIAEERQWGTLSVVLGSPAPRLPVFLGRSLIYIADGFITSLLGLGIAALIFHMDLGRVNASALALSVLLVAFSCTGIGFVFGSLSLVVRDGWMITSTFISALYILSGVNFPVASLPAVLQPVASALPLTRGVMAARLALQGGAAGEIAPLLVGEVLVGAVYMVLGYVIFRLIERRSMSSGALDAV
jgi:ABC-2 type transport system permease protein